ncbi:hypothetical protein S83_069678, partial [Arachis hypogaea]
WAIIAYHATYGLMALTMLSKKTTLTNLARNLSWEPTSSLRTESIFVKMAYWRMAKVSSTFGQRQASIVAIQCLRRRKQAKGELQRRIQ